ncbi:neurofilament heavy polypeptide [Nilaparvata lugens]|uniref:neurofilament heavy polypeptide n=1 Tax=Nilaparvata lugens TaxID=108931 RepID=UPI00193D25F3|nr:neurofilament heavy polypeptide [Nilaparvata lugens]XP_039282262.1 neurofilament heavy polypeptide [Nilaparvata lugens]
MKIQNSPKSSPSNTCSPKKNSSPQKMKDINRLTSPLCQRLPNGDKSPSATNINPTPEKVVSNGNAGDKRILDSDSDSDSDDSDSKPQEIPSKDVSQKNSSSKTESFKNKLTPSPQKVMKLIKPIQSEKLMKMKNLMESTFRSQSMSNLSKTAEASPRKASSDSDAVTISRIELTSLINDAVNANATVALLKKDVLELKKDQLELRKELCDLKTLLRKEKEKSKHTKEDNLEEGSVLPNDKKELIDQLLAKQATQIFSESEKSPKKKKSPKKAKEPTTVSPDEEEKPLQTNSDSETCPTLVLVTDEPKLKKKKIVEVVEQQDQIDNENDNTNVEKKKKRKRKRRNESVEDNVEDIEPTRVDPLASSSTETPVTPDSQSQRPKKKRSRKIKNKNNEEVKEKKQREKDVEQTDEAPLNNVVTLHAGINEFEQPHVNEERKKKKKKLAAHVEQIETLSFNNEVSLNSGINEFEQQNVNEARKKKKKKHGVQEAELKSHFVDNVSVVPIQSELQSEVNNEVKKKKKKKHEQNDESNWQKSPKNVTSPNQNPLFKIKKQKLKNKLKTKSTLNISKQHVLSYMDEFCDLKPKTDKINLETAKNEVLGSKDSKKFKSKKKNKVCVNDAVESATSKKEVKKSKKEAKDSYKLTPSTSLDVTNFWM